MYLIKMADVKRDNEEANSMPEIMTRAYLFRAMNDAFFSISYIFRQYSPPLEGKVLLVIPSGISRILGALVVGC